MTAIIVYSVIGLLVGGFHAVSLWHAVEKARPQTAILRLSSVGGLFVVVALWGGILPMAAGWLCGFPMTAVALYFRKRA